MFWAGLAVWTKELSWGESRRFENGDQAGRDREPSTAKGWLEAGGRLGVGQARRFWGLYLKSSGKPVKNT